MDKIYRQVLSEFETLRSSQNSISKNIKSKPTAEQITQGKELKNKLKLVEDKLKKAETDLNQFLKKFPIFQQKMFPLAKMILKMWLFKTVGKIPKFDFQPLDHSDLGEKLDIIDIKKAAQISGSRFGYFKDQGAVLEMSIMFYAFKKLVSKGFMV